MQLAHSAVMFASNCSYIAALSTVALASHRPSVLPLWSVVTALSHAFSAGSVGVRRWSAVTVGNGALMSWPGWLPRTFDAWVGADPANVLGDEFCDLSI